MPNLSRRKTLQLTAGAAVLGPSILFTRTADAAFRVYEKRGLQAGNFAVKIAGIYDAVPGVLKIDLGSGEWSPDSIKPQFGMLKIALATESDAPDLNFAIAEQKWPERGLKISVALFAEEGKTPAITFHALGVKPESTSVNKAGNRLLNFTVSGMETVTHKLRRGQNSALVELPPNELKVQIRGLNFASISKMAKYEFKNSMITESQLDPTVASIAWGGPTKVKTPARLKYEEIALKASDRLAVTSIVTAGDSTQWKQWTSLAAKLKRSTTQLKIAMNTTASERAQDIHFFHFSKVQLVSVEFPKLEVGSTALVAQTFHFSVEKGTA